MTRLTGRNFLPEIEKHGVTAYLIGGAVVFSGPEERVEVARSVMERAGIEAEVSEVLRECGRDVPLDLPGLVRVSRKGIRTSEAQGRFGLRVVADAVREGLARCDVYGRFRATAQGERAFPSTEKEIPEQATGQESSPGDLLTALPLSFREAVARFGAEEIRQAAKAGKIVAEADGVLKRGEAA